MDAMFKWVGGKRALRNRIIDEFPQLYDSYVEVFGGAGWVLFGKERHAVKEVYNDINGELVNLFRCVKHHPEELKRQLQYTLIAREEFDQLKNCNRAYMTDLQRAAVFYILIKNSFGGNVQTFGCAPTNTVDTIERIGELHQRLKKVVIEHKSYEDLLKVYDRAGTLFYLDPPYYGAEQYYKTGFGEADHKQLRELLEHTKGKWVLSYNDNQHIRDLYAGYNVIEVDRPHNLRGNGERYKELIIKNF